MNMAPFLRDYAGRRFRYGRTDCVLFLADFLVWMGRNRDPAEGVRGTYHDEASCVRVLRERGGLLRIVAAAAREMNLERVAPDEAPAGSVAVIRYTPPSGRETHFGAVRTPSGRWAVKATDGLLMLKSPRVVAAWKV